ncbi:hypothetical protein D3C87_1851320 [compost metagenome]
MRAPYAQYTDRRDDLKAIMVAGTFDHIRLDQPLLKDDLRDRMFFIEVQGDMGTGGQHYP